MADHSYDKRIEGLRARFFRATDELGFAEPRDQAKFARALFDAIADSIGERETASLQAQNAVVEIVDETSGALIRRYLELSYAETDNGLRLTGENMKGETADIVFLSEEAIRKIADIRGAGRDEPRCQE